MPIEKDAMFGVVIDPEVAKGGFAGAWLKATDGGFVDLKVIGGEKTFGNELTKRQEPVGEVVVPGANEVAAQLNAVTGRCAYASPRGGRASFDGEKILRKRGLSAMVSRASAGRPRLERLNR